MNKNISTFAAAFTETITRKNKRKKVQETFAGLKKVFTFAAPLKIGFVIERKKAKKVQETFAY